MNLSILVIIISFIFNFSRSQVLKECSINALDQVTEILPNFIGSTQPCSYSGFAPLDKNNDSALFYWYFPNLKNDPKAPVLLWFHGESDVSDIFGCFVENLCPFSVIEEKGIYKISYNEELEKYSWIYSYNVLFIDNPVGTGYSYTSNNKYPRSINEVSESLWETLQYFTGLHPETLNNDWFYGGENYAGQYVPYLSSYTLKYNLEVTSGKRKENFIPLKGNLLGNAIINNVQQTVIGIEQSRRATLLAPYQVSQAKALAVNCQSSNANKEENSQEACKLVDEYIQSVSGLNINSYQVTINALSNLKISFTNYFKNSEVQKVLHAIPPAKSKENSDHSSRLMSIENYLKNNSVSQITEVLTHIPCLFFTSHFDGKSGPSSLYKWIELLGNPWNNILNQARNIWYLNGLPSGFWMNYDNLTVITIIGSANPSSYFSPKVVKSMIDIYLTDANWDRFKNTTNVTISMCKYMNDCNGNGKCSSSGACICDLGYFFEDCSVQPNIYNSSIKENILQPRGFLYLKFNLKEGDHFIVIEGEHASSLNIYYSYTSLPTYDKEAAGLSLSRNRAEKARRIYLNSEEETFQSVYVSIQNSDFLKSNNFTIELIQFNEGFQSSPSIRDILKPLGCFFITLLILIFTLVKTKGIGVNK